MADVVTLRQRLAEAEQAAHDLATGQRVVEVMRDGKRMRFSEANAGSLQSYIDGLASDIADAEIATNGGRSRRRFIAVRF